MGPGHKAYPKVYAAYEKAGFRVDSPSVFDSNVHVNAETCLKALRSHGLYQVDVTQPLGVGKTKCATTYVTRCLVGEPGSTYKYLGLRMFSHPWTSHEDSGAVGAALSGIHALNRSLSKRAAQLISTTEEGAGSSRCDFTIALVNCMEPEGTLKLKLEPHFKEDKCTVSWHADSSLEHFSTIGVYHTVEQAAVAAGGKSGSKQGNAAKEKPWRIALRVEHNAEGPAATKKKSSGGSVPSATPAIAHPLPSGTSYFMLGNMNHHHQHAVIVGSSRRISSTHRVGKWEGHSFDYILGRCKAVVGSFNKRSLKQLKAEQLLLSELEFEWLRQWYIQGSQHRDLHKWWHKPIAMLLRYWVQLEARTKSVLEALCFGDDAMLGMSKKVQVKKAAFLEAFESREQISPVYDAMVEALQDRAQKRSGWLQREGSEVFASLGETCRPLPVPLFTAEAPSQLPVDTSELALDTAAWKDAHASKASYVNQSTRTKWISSPVYLEMQAPWAMKLLKGIKTIETRSYRLPLGLLGKEVAIVESPSGAAGVSKLGDHVEAATSGLRVLGVVKFFSCNKYASQRQWTEDLDKHCVTPGSGYGYREGVYGWAVQVGSCKVYEEPQECPAMTRRVRSLFTKDGQEKQVVAAVEEVDAGDGEWARKVRKECEELTGEEVGQEHKKKKARKQSKKERRKEKREKKPNK
ncbi:unnamed protein product [Chrysoparadoxa australica]